MHDVLSNVPQKRIECLNTGFVNLIDVMPRLVPEDQKTADYAVCQAARVSYGQGTKTVNEDKGLIFYLLRHMHTTPFEMVEFKMHLKMPVFVARQFCRHRMSSMNEYSGRYSVYEEDFYQVTPENLKIQSKNNKQGGTEVAPEELFQKFDYYQQKTCDESYQTYESFLNDGISREQARIGLPMSLYTQMYWKIDLHNLFHFLALRCDSHAQYEIRVFGDAMLKLIEPIVPWCVEAWNNYHPMRSAIKVNRLEVEALRAMLKNTKNVNIDSNNKREQAEWEEKIKKIKGE